MADDPILQAIANSGGQKPPAEDPDATDPILKAIATGGDAKQSVPSGDPIIAAIAAAKPKSDLRTPNLNEVATDTQAATLTPSLTDRAAKMGSGMSLAPPVFADTTGMGLLPKNPVDQVRANQMSDAATELTQASNPQAASSLAASARQLRSKQDLDVPQVPLEQVRAQVARDASPVPRTSPTAPASGTTPEEQQARAIMSGNSPAALGSQAAQGVDVTNLPTTQAAGADFSQDVNTGSKKLPLPYRAPDGSLRTMALGDFQKLTNDYLDDPSIPKSRGAAFAAEWGSNVVSALNDTFFSPIGIASSVTGVVSARALQQAGTHGVQALKYAQEYKAIQAAGGTAQELAEAADRMNQSIVAAAKSQGIVVAAKIGQKAAGAGFAAQGASQVIQGAQTGNYRTVLGGLAGLALGASTFVFGGGMDVESQVKGETANIAREGMKNAGDVSAQRTQQVGAEPGTEQSPQVAPMERQLPPSTDQAIAPASSAPGGSGAPTPSVASVGAGETLAPESNATLKAQTDAFAAGTNPAVYFPKGHGNIPEPPEGATVTVVGGNKAGAGTWFHDSDITPQEIRTAVKEGTFGDLLGYSQSKEEAISGGRPAAVIARDENGGEVKAALVDSSNPQVVAEQAATLQRQFPEAQISVEPAETIISDRLGLQSPSSTNTQEGPVSPVTPEDLNGPQTSGDAISGAIAETAPAPHEQLATHVAAIEQKVAANQPVTMAEVNAMNAVADQVEGAKNVPAKSNVETQSRATNRQPASGAASTVQSEGVVAGSKIPLGPPRAVRTQSSVAATGSSSSQSPAGVTKDELSYAALINQLYRLPPGSEERGRLEDDAAVAREEIRERRANPNWDLSFAQAQTLLTKPRVGPPRGAPGTKQKLESPGDLLHGRTISAEEEQSNATPSVGSRGDQALEGASPQNVQEPAGERGTGEPRAESSGADKGRIRGRDSERNGPAGELGSGEGQSSLPAKRGRPTASGREPGQSIGASQAGNDYRITEADHIGEGAPRAKYAANTDAIRILKSIEADGRSATPAEQSQLVRYSGWGWTGNGLFNEQNREWHNQRKELQALLTDEEYRAARASTTNAHYTSQEVIEAMWSAIRRLGFKGGRILEPSAGVGHFLGLMPSDLAQNSRKTAIELDPISGRILKQLYQNADTRIHGFEKFQGPDNFYDLAVSNVPFGDYKVHDPAYNKLNLTIHNYFIAKMLDKVRPGGIAAIITSHHTLDAVNSKIRKAFQDRGDLIGAIRLPETAFQKNAGTEVTTDMLFFRKRAEGEKPGGEPFATLSTVHDAEKNPIQVNEYFDRHPTMALGEHSLEGSMYGARPYALKPLRMSSYPLEQALGDAIAQLPENVVTAHEVPFSATQRATADSVPDFGETKQHGLKIKNSKVFRRLGESMVEQTDYPKSNVTKLKGMLQVRDAVRELFQAESAYGINPEILTDLRGRLNRFYDNFVVKHGPFHERGNLRVMDADPDLPLLLSLEKYDSKTKTAQKADAFFRQTVAPRKQVEHVDTAKEALVVSLSERGRLDFDQMSKLTGKTPAELQTDLKSQGLVFHSPEGHWETSDAYLSGNVRKKLREAQDAARVDPEYRENAEALRKVQPKDLTAGEIDVRLGASWIPAEDLRDFIDQAILNQPNSSSRTAVTHVQSEGLWSVHAPYAKYNIPATQTWGTDRMHAAQIIEGALNLKQPTVYDYTADGKATLNEKETLAARDKLEKIEEEFKRWTFREPARAERLTALYNELYNSNRLRTYDGSHLTLPGIAAGVTLRPHQKDAIWRAIQGGNTGFFHVVGAGKTYTIIGSAMEMRRLGTSKKPMIVVPNHLVEQWAQDFQKLYPSANVLAATKDDFEKGKRQEFMSRIATGDWDSVIVPHKSFELLPASEGLYNRIMQEHLDALGEHIQELAAAEGKKSKTVKQLEKMKARLEAKIAARANRESKDNTLNFEELGVDSLFVDEAHMYKNLFFPTKMGNIAGIPKSDSNRAFDMYMKSRYISELNNGKNVVFATGTPVSNTMAEIWTMMRYLDENRLREMGLQHFDSWAATFGNTVQSFEVSPENPARFRISNRFARFVNVPELTNMFKQSADVKLDEDLDLPKPKLRGGKPMIVTVPSSERTQKYVESLGKRADAIRQRKVDPTEDNMLKVTGDGRKVALDYRTIKPNAPDEDASKINAAVRNIARIHEDGREAKRTQVVFLDLATPSDAGEKKGAFNAYEDIKNKLIARGILPQEIQFIHSAKTDKAKQALFDAVNEGSVRVVLGSTDKMGVGTNIQKRLIALHHLDSPWRPSDIEQREGRILRQGNTNPEVEVYRYVTEGTFDAYMWQLIENKANFINQVMRGGENARTAEDVDGRSLSYAEAKALATGDPRVLEKIKSDLEVNKLQKLASAYQSAKLNNQVALAAIPGRIAAHEQAITHYDSDIATRNKNKTSEFFLKVGKQTFDKREEAGAAINAAIEANRSNAARKIGSYAGFEVWSDGSGNGFLRGENSYYFTANYQSPVGTVQSLQSDIRNLESYKENRQKQIEALTEERVTRQAEAGKPFDKQKQLETALAKKAELDKALKVNAEDPTADRGTQGVEYTGDGKTVQAPKTPEDELSNRIDETIRGVATGEIAGANVPIKLLLDYASLAIQKALNAVKLGRKRPLPEERPEPPPEPQRRPASAAPRTPPGVTRDHIADAIRAGAAEANRAGNIRLDKLNAAEDVINEIRRMARERAGAFNEQRRGHVSFSQTRDAAERMVEEGLFTEKDLKNMKKGTALNAEELLAARGMLIESAKRVREAAKEVSDDPSVDNVLRFQQMLSRHAGIQKAVTGAVAEAGRALSQQRMVANALNSSNKTNHERVLDALGGQALSEDAALKLAQIPEDDIVALNNFIRSQKYWSSAQKIEAYWIANVLSSPRTPIKKTLGDITLATVETANRFVTAAVDPVVAALQRRPREFFLSDAIAAPLAYLSAIPEATRKGAYILAHGYDNDATLNMEAPFRYEFKGGLKNPWNYPGRILSGVTKWFQVAAFQGELHAQAVRQALKEGLRGSAMTNRAAELIQHPTDRMIDESMRQAQLQTYTESPDVLSRVFMSARDKVKLPAGVPLIGGMRPLRFVIPFVQIPYNLAKQSVRYSPIGLLRLNDFDVAKKPEASKVLGRALIGMGIMAAFAYLAAKALLTGAAPSSPAERDEFYRSGKQPYSIKIGNHWISYKMAGPFALTAAAVAAYHDKFGKKNEMSPTDSIFAMAAAMGQAMLDESFLRGLKNVFDAMSDPERFAGRFATGIAGGFVPMESALRTLNDSLDPTVRSAKDMYERIISGLPVLSEKLRPRLDALGRPSIKEGSSGWRALVPGGVADATAKSPIDGELDRLHALGLQNIGFAGKSLTVDSYKVPLEPAERNQYQELRGRYIRAYLGKLFNSDEYKGMADEDRIQEAESAIRDAQHDAREQMIDQVLQQRRTRMAGMQRTQSFQPAQ